MYQKILTNTCDNISSVLAKKFYPVKRYLYLTEKIVTFENCPFFENPCLCLIHHKNANIHDTDPYKVSIALYGSVEYF